MTSVIHVMRLVTRSLRRMSSSPHQGVNLAKDAGTTKDTYLETGVTAARGDGDNKSREKELVKKKMFCSGPTTL